MDFLFHLPNEGMIDKAKDGFYFQTFKREEVGERFLFKMICRAKPKVYWSLPFFIFSFIFFQSSRAQVFRDEPQLYFPWGSQHEYLSANSQQALDDLMRLRISLLDTKVEEDLSLFASVHATQAQLKESGRYRGLCVGLACGLIGAVASVYGFRELVALSGGPTGMSSSVYPYVLGLIGLIGGQAAGSVGYGLAQAGHTIPPRASGEYLDLRGAKIIDLAERLSAEMRAMAVPKKFWIRTQLRDFLDRFLSFAYLEGLLLNEFIEEERKMTDSLARMGLKSEDVKYNLEVASDSNLRAKHLRALIKLRRLERDTLKVMRSALNDLPDSKHFDLNTMDPAFCLNRLVFLAQQ